MYDREMETGSEWQLFGGQLRDLSVQSTFADLQDHVLQNSWHDDSTAELLYQRSAADSLEDLAWHSAVDVIGFKPPSSLKVQEGPSLYEDDLNDVLSRSPEEAFLPVDDDGAVSNASTVENHFIVTVPEYGDSSGLNEAKFDYGSIVSGHQYLNSVISQNLYENRQVLHDLIAVDQQAVRTDSFSFEHGSALDSLHYENHYKPAAELDDIECSYDSLLDADNVCNILKQLVYSDQHSSRPILLSVSPEEVESVLSSDFATPVDDRESVLVPCSPSVIDISFLPSSPACLTSAAVLTTEYSQECLSPASSSYSQASSPSIPYSVAARSDRRLKKKEQNKTAALRYRNKKREEKGVVYSEVEELEQKNAQLQARADDLTKEINYLKGLLEEIKKQ